MLPEIDINELGKCFFECKTLKTPYAYICVIVDQHTELDVYSPDSLKNQSTELNMLLPSNKLIRFPTIQFFFFHVT